jgi:hypothetical protein
MNLRAIFELKCRRTHYDDLMIEQTKWASLAEYAVLRDFRAFYISSTPLGIYCWQIDPLTPPRMADKEPFLQRPTSPIVRPTDRPVGFLHIDTANDLLRHSENLFA